VQLGPSRIILPELRIAHAIEDERVEVGVSSRDSGYALLERIGEMNRARFLPLIERIFDEFDRPGELIRIERIDLDLGRFAEGELGQAEERLAAALREALRKAMPSGAGTGSGSGSATGSGDRAHRMGQALVDALLHYLLRGVWPYGSALDSTTLPADLLARLIEEEPGALVAMLRRHGRSDAIVGRLVRQMPAALLKRLLRVLEPEDAAWILIYMDETKASHAAEPLVDEAPEPFERLLWTIVLRDALHRAGLRANRRAFLRNLIERIAEAGTSSYAELVAQIGRGLGAIPGEGLGAGSLLSIIEELGVEERSAARPPLSFAALAALLEGEQETGTSARRRKLHPAEAQALAAGLRAHGAQARWLLRRLIARDSEALLERLDGVLKAEEIAALLLPETKARQAGASLRAARSRKAEAALLVAAARESITDARPQGEAASEPTPLERLERLLERGPAGEPERWAAALPRAIAAAAADDEVGLRRSMRRFAFADAKAFMDRVGLGKGAASVLPLLLPEPAASTIAGLIGLAGCSAEEGARLAQLAARLPVSASPGTVAEQGLILLARLRRLRIAALRGDLLDEARRVGGADNCALAVLIEEDEGAEAAHATSPEMRRAQALDVLRAVLHGQDGTTATRQTATHLGGSAAASLAMGPDILREALGGASIDRKIAASGLLRIGDRALLRLIALLAPRSGARRDRLRRRLAQAPRGAALAGLAAELLLSDTVREENEEAPFPTTTPIAGHIADLQTVEAALREGGRAPSTQAVRQAIARLLQKRPMALVPLFAGSAGAGATAILADPSFLSRVFADLPGAERGAIRALAKLLAGPKGGSFLVSEKAAAALAAATRRALGRRDSGGIAAHWLAEMMRSASLSEQARLKQAIAAQWPDEPRHAAVRTMLGLGALEGRGRGASFGGQGAALLADMTVGRKGGTAPGSDDRRGKRMPSDAVSMKGERGSAAETFDGHPGGDRDARHDRASSRGSLLDPRPFDGDPGRDRHVRSGRASVGRASVDPRPFDGPPSGDRNGRPARASSGGALLDPRTPDGRPGAVPGEGHSKARTHAGGEMGERGSPTWLLQVLRQRPPGYARMLRLLLRSRGAAERLARTLPESLLTELLFAASPREGRSLLGAAETIAAALAAGGGSLSRSALWETVLGAAGQGGGVSMLLDLLLGASGRPGLRPPAGKDGAAAMETRLATLAALRGHAALRAALAEREYERRRRRKTGRAGESDGRRREEADRPEDRKLWDGADEDAGQRIAVANAGLVLVNPYLPVFFQRLGLLNPADPKGGTWLSKEAQGRAVHLLQYLVDGSCERPEPMLALNKLLCGQALGQPVAAAIEPTAEEKATCRSLLEAMLANWPMLKDSSVEALQETFLQREGCIVRTDAGWRVDVERKVLDVLIDSIPWSFSMILHPWMKEPISVEW
jgi:hypothetical protein